MHYNFLNKEKIQIKTNYGPVENILIVCCESSLKKTFKYKNFFFERQAKKSCEKTYFKRSDKQFETEAHLYVKPQFCNRESPVLKNKINSYWYV